MDETDITVKNMGGEVAFNGTVPSYPQYLEAAAAARRVAGVKNVHNHLEVACRQVTTTCGAEPELRRRRARSALTSGSTFRHGGRSRGDRCEPSGHVR